MTISTCSATIMLVTIPLWISEISPPRGRAILVSLHPVLILFGGCLPNWVALPFYNADGSADLRGPAWIGCSWPLLCFLCTWYLPETPRHLLKKGRENEAWKVLNDLHSTGEHNSQHYVQLEFEQMRRHIESQRSAPNNGPRPSLNSMSKRTGIAIALNFCVVSSGGFAVQRTHFTLWIQNGVANDSDSL